MPSKKEPTLTSIGEIAPLISTANSVETAQPNMMILADAMVALPQLLERFRSKVRLSLVDPPYNTTSNFHHYRDSISHESWITDRRTHFSWIRDLLTTDGSLWIHLDDSELHYCKVMLDELFGRENFVTTIVWQKSRSRENRTVISTTHEYILVYAKEYRAWAKTRNLLAMGTEQLDRYSNPDNDIRGPWISGDMTAKAGPGRRAAQFYEIVAPSGRVLKPAKGMAWRYTRERFDELHHDGRVSFGHHGDNMPRLKRFLSETQQGLVPTTWWPGDEVGTTDTAKKQLRRLFPDLVPFETPKPEELAAKVMAIASNRGDLVLDCYAGSGTVPATAHKMGRKWIAIEREERTFHEFLAPRLERVVSGTDPGGITEATVWQGGGSFSVINSTWRDHLGSAPHDSQLLLKATS